MSEFLRPRLTGARFEGGAIPLDMLNELPALGEMIVAVAKWRYLQDHPDRKRTPQGFAESASLRLTGIEEGSAIPVIELAFTAPSSPNAPQLPGIPGAYGKYFEEARDLIINDIGTAEHSEEGTYGLPDEYLRYFDRFGRRLHEGESIDFDSKNSDGAARLTKASRRKLIRASQISEFTEEVSIRGSIPEMDQDRMSFELQPLEGRKITGAIVEQHRDIILEAFNRYKADAKLLIKGIGKYDRQERLVRIDPVEDIVALDPLDILSRLDEFRTLKDGWYEGVGRAPRSEGLNWLATQFEQHYPADLPLPYLYPTPEGGVRAEWSQGPNAVVLETDLDNHSASWLWFNRDSDAEHERELNLDDTEHWNWWVSEVRNKLSERA